MPFLFGVCDALRGLFLFPIFYRCNILNSLLGIDKSTGQFTFHSAGVSSVSSSSSSCYSFSFYHELLPSFSFGYTTCYYWRGRKRGKLAATAAPRPFRCSSLAVQVDNGCLCFGADFDFLSLLYLSLSLSPTQAEKRNVDNTRDTLWPMTNLTSSLLSRFFIQSSTLPVFCPFEFLLCELRCRRPSNLPP